MLDQVQTIAGSDKTEAVKTRVFLSYSRKDRAFTGRLAEALAARGYAPDYDQSAFDPANVHSGISAEDEWWKRLQEMIAASDVIVFVVSPDSAASDVCDEEIAYARNLGKRIIPILRRPIDFAKAPPRLSALNVKINFADDREEPFAAALNQLCAALDLDVAWYRESRRLTELALKWHVEGQPADRIMSPADIRATERLLERRPRNADLPPQALIEFRDASRIRLEEEMRRLRRTTGRAFVKPAEQALANGFSEHALRVAAAGALLANDLDLVLIPELWAPAAQAMFEGRVLAVLNGHERTLRSAWFSPDAKSVVTASHDNTARIWETETGKQILVLEGHLFPLNSASFSPDGKRVVTSSNDNTARVWEADTGRLITMLDHEEMVPSAAFSPDGKRVVTSCDDHIARIWEAETGKQIADLEGHADGLSDARFSPDGQYVVTASYDETARIWDAESGIEIAILGGRDGKVLSASFSPDGKRVVTASDDTTARIWEAKTGKEIAVLRAHRAVVHSVAFSLNGQRIVTASSDKTAWIWDAHTGRAIVALKAHTDEVNSAAFSADGKRVVTASSDKTVRLWEAETGKEIAVLKAHTDRVNTAAFSPDGKRVATASSDNTARLWHAESRREIRFC